MHTVNSFNTFKSLFDKDDLHMMSQTPEGILWLKTKTLSRGPLLDLFYPGLTQNLASGERSEAIQKSRHRKDWIATPPAEARNDVVRKCCYQQNGLASCFAF
jgi:hypothetical protein